MEKEENEKLEDDLNWEVFLDRMRLKKSEAARLIGAAPAMMTDWVNRETFPSHKYLKKLCMIGMTAQEMFGKEAGDALVKNSSITHEENLSPEMQELLKHPDFVAGMKKAFSEIEAMKKKGVKQP